ncbi:MULTISPECIES: hypothetical protein [Bacillaceae]|uniref:Uncharacterized protein n=1 Tax=Evansella alkalicola TaxID=745819 RepID=A0ABS6JQF9_9BACI|nr:MULTISPECIES: hypothetical protein [Bacillaceae]MBU9720784.1 hypothetical protein [Bacillus alkalicola]
MSTLKRKERLKKEHEKGLLHFIFKEGIVNIGLKLGGLYLVITFLVAYRANYAAFLEPNELNRTFIFLIIIVVLGLYWAVMWYIILSVEKKREADGK